MDTTGRTPRSRPPDRWYTKHYSRYPSRTPKYQYDVPLVPRGASSGPANSRFLFVGNLPKEVEESEIRETFEAHGQIADLYLLPTGDYGVRECILSFWDKKAAGSCLGTRIFFRGEEAVLRIRDGHPRSDETDLMKRVSPTPEAQPTADTKPTADVPPAPDAQPAADAQLYPDAQPAPDAQATVPANLQKSVEQKRKGPARRPAEKEEHPAQPPQYEPTIASAISHESDRDSQISASIASSHPTASNPDQCISPRKKKSSTKNKRRPSVLSNIATAAEEPFVQSQTASDKPSPLCEQETYQQQMGPQHAEDKETRPPTQDVRCAEGGGEQPCWENSRLFQLESGVQRPHPVHAQGKGVQQRRQFAPRFEEEGDSQQQHHFADAKGKGAEPRHPFPRHDEEGGEQQQHVVDAKESEAQHRWQEFRPAELHTAAPPSQSLPVVSVTERKSIHPAAEPTTTPSPPRSQPVVSPSGQASISATAMSKRFLFVGGVPQKAKMEDLERVFGRHGKVHRLAKLPNFERDGNISLFLTYCSEAAASRCMKASNWISAKKAHVEFRRRLSVGEETSLINVDTTEIPIPAYQTRHLWVGGDLPRDTSVEEMQQEFGRHGKIVDIYPVGRSTSGNAAFCIVYEDELAAGRCSHFDNMIRGRRTYIKPNFKKFVEKGSGDEKVAYKPPETLHNHAEKNLQTPVKLWRPPSPMRLTETGTLFWPRGPNDKYKSPETQHGTVKDEHGSPKSFTQKLIDSTIADKREGQTAPQQQSVDEATHGEGASVPANAERHNDTPTAAREINLDEPKEPVAAPASEPLVKEADGLSADLPSLQQHTNDVGEEPAEDAGEATVAVSEHEDAASALEGNHKDAQRHDPELGQDVDIERSETVSAIWQLAMPNEPGNSVSSSHEPFQMTEEPMSHMAQLSFSFNSSWMELDRQREETPVADVESPVGDCKHDDEVGASHSDESTTELTPDDNITTQSSRSCSSEATPEIPVVPELSDAGSRSDENKPYIVGYMWTAENDKAMCSRSGHTTPDDHKGQSRGEEEGKPGRSSSRSRSEGSSPPSTESHKEATESRSSSTSKGPVPWKQPKTQTYDGTNDGAFETWNQKKMQPEKWQFKSKNGGGITALSNIPTQMAKKYEEKWDRLVNLEMAAEEEAVMERLKVWSPSRLQSEGILLLGLRAVSGGKFFGKKTWKLLKPDRGMLPFNRFSNGDLLLLSRDSPLDEKAATAQVVSVNSFQLCVCFHGDSPGNMEEGQWRVDKGSSTITYDRMRFALMGANYDVPDLPTNEEIDFSIQAGGPRKVQKKRKNYGYRNFWEAGDPEYEEAVENGSKPRGTKLRAALLLPKQELVKQWVAEESDLISEEASAWAKTVLEGGKPKLKSGLNESQDQAVALAMRNRMSLLQGPPGTGKTTTIVRFIKLLKKDFEAEYPILACAQSNVAVDNLLEGLVNEGVCAVRVGQPVKVREGLRDCTLDALIENDKHRDRIEALRVEILENKSRLNMLRGKEKAAVNKELTSKTKELNKLRDRMMARILKKADVICSTCVGAGSDILENVTFPMVVLDEGSQCSEPEALIPIMKGSEHIVLVGDHYQLPPVCQSREAELHGLSVSLFERLFRAGLPSAMLTVQYRMHPIIAAFPSQQFYNCQLRDGITAEDRPLLPNFPFPNPGGPIAFFKVLGEEKMANEAGGSKYNREEAKAVTSIVGKLLAECGVAPDDIGVVTPYAAQVRCITESLQGRVAGSLEVKTVDGYQGREKEVIVFSAVRANSAGSVGFLEDWRRLNVAITRPRRALILVGHLPTLDADQNWSSYIAWLLQHGFVKAWSDIDGMCCKQIADCEV